MVQNILGNMGTFLFSLYKAPKKVLKTLERVRRDFFWGKKENENTIHWVKWSHAVLDKEAGGIGINSMENINKSLLAKW